MLRRSLIVSAVTLMVTGCSGENDPVPVSGRVLVDGKPMANLTVLFQPVGSADNPNPGRGSYGVTDADGRFTLYQDGKPGAVVGHHKVAIFTNISKEELMAGGGGEELDEDDVGSPDGEMPTSKEVIPPKYNDQTILTFDVPPDGTDQANFEIESIKGSRNR